MTEPATTPALGGIRLSRLTDDSTSLIRQRNDLLRRPGVRYVHIAEDGDVSATKYPPAARPDIGPWLTDPGKIAQYDEVIVWKLDRFCRKASDMREMMRWADEHGKRLIFMQDNLVYDPRATGIARAINDAMIALVAAFAEMEALNTSVRVSNLKAYLRETHSWQGGSPPFGYRIQKDGKRKILVHSSDTLPIYKEIERRIIEGESRNSIAKDLSSRGVLSPKDWGRLWKGVATKGTAWTGATIGGLFASDSVLGYETRTDPKTKRGVTVRDADGLPVQTWEPITDAETLRRVREALQQRSKARRPHVSVQLNPLRDVARCYDCGANLSRGAATSGPVYLFCYKSTAAAASCGNRGYVPIDQAWGYLEDHFLHYRGADRVEEGRFVPASAEAAGLPELQSEFAAVSDQAAKARSQAARDRLQKRLDELDAEMLALETQPRQSGRWESSELKETYAERWAASDDETRREMIIKAGTVLRIKRTPKTHHYTVSIETETD